MAVTHNLAINVNISLIRGSGSYRSCVLSAQAWPAPLGSPVEEQKESLSLPVEPALSVRDA